MLSSDNQAYIDASMMKFTGDVPLNNGVLKKGFDMQGF